MDNDDAARLLSGHELCVTSVAVAIDDSFVVSGGYDCRVLRWEGTECVWSLRLPDLVNSVRISESLDRCIVACADRFAYLLDAASGNILQSFGPHNDDVNVAIFAGTSRIYTACDNDDSVIREWCVSSAAVTRHFLGHDSSVTTLILSDDGAKLLSSGEDASARVWCLETGRCLQKVSLDADPETAAWLTNEDFVTGTNAGVLQRWTIGVASHTVEARFPAAVRVVRRGFSANYLFLGTYDGRIYTVDSLSFRVEQAWKNGWFWARDIALGLRKVYTASFRSRPAELPPLSGYGAPTIGLNCLASVSKGIITAGDSGSVHLLPEATVLYHHQSIVNCLGESPGGRCIASGCYLGELIVFEWETRSVERYSFDGGPINSLVFIDEHSLCIAQYDGSLTLLNVRDGARRRISLVGAPVKSIAYSHKYGLLLAGVSDSRICGYSLEGDLIFVSRHPGMVLVNSVSVSPNHDCFASASRDGLVRIWATSSGELMTELPRVHEKSVKAVAMISDDHVASASYDGKVLLWTRKEEQWSTVTCKGHGKPGSSSVTYSGSRVVSAGWDGRVSSWNEDGTLDQTWNLASVFR